MTARRPTRVQVYAAAAVAVATHGIAPVLRLVAPETAVNSVVKRGVRGSMHLPATDPWGEGWISRSVRSNGELAWLFLDDGEDEDWREGLAVYSCGPNRLDELGGGDDVHVVPGKRYRYILYNMVAAPQSWLLSCIMVALVMLPSVVSPMQRWMWHAFATALLVWALVSALGVAFVHLVFAALAPPGQAFEFGGLGLRAVQLSVVSAPVSASVTWTVLVLGLVVNLLIRSEPSASTP